MHYVVIALTGLLAGYLASVITRDKDRGVLALLVIGLIGSALGSLVFHAIGLNARNWIGLVVTSTVGATLLLLVLQGIRRRRR